MTLHYRTMWLSDTHLGSGASRADELYDFLCQVRVDKLYLVGDIVDLIRLRAKSTFPENHLKVLFCITEMAKTGTEVIYVPGNHDHDFRMLVGGEILRIPIRMDDTYVSASGQRWLVTHGDIFDGRIRKGTRLEKFGAAAYFFLVRTDALFNRMRRKFGQAPASFSTAIKHRLKRANEYMQRFEAVAAAYAKENGYDGIICGHIHRPALRMIDGCLYANDGDWVEHSTALAESHDGQLLLLRWNGRSTDIIGSDMPPALAA